MDQRDIEEHGKDRGEGWGIGIKKVFFFLISWNCSFMLIYVYVYMCL
jgi:hypothetical protein